jgi:2-(1,2-epoxy-1,2-dihydrophenyl)acetyl-CoA isomerase
MQDLELRIHDGVATLTLNRPEARNAISTAMKDELSTVVPQIAADPGVRAVVLTGAGGVFSAGGDLRGMDEVRASMTVEGWRDRMRSVHPLIRTLLEMDKPLIAAVDGAASALVSAWRCWPILVLASPRALFA